MPHVSFASLVVVAAIAGCPAAGHARAHRLAMGGPAI
jgi:hypothetical protein